MTAAPAHTETLTMPSAFPAFLNGFAAIHTAMRRDATRLVDAVSTADVADASALVRWYARFESAIEHHHEREDDTVWPALVERDPTFAACLDELAADHAALDTALAAARAALAALVDGGISERQAAVHAAQRLSDLLHDHLAREEAAAFPRLGEVYTAEEYRNLEKMMARGSSLGQLAFEAPWVLDELEPHIISEMMGVVGAPLRLMYRLVFVRRYRALAAPLLAVAR